MFLQRLGMITISNYEVEINEAKDEESLRIVRRTQLLAAGILLRQKQSHKRSPKPLLAQVFEP